MRLGLLLFLLAAPPSLEEVRKLPYDELYLRVSSLKTADPKLAAVLVDGSRAALEAKDGPIAMGLADKAHQLDPRSLAACLVQADAAESLQLPDAEDKALQAAVKLAPRDTAVLLRAAKFSEGEGDLERARDLFGRVPTPEGRAHKKRLELELQQRRAALAMGRADEAARLQRQRLNGETAGDGEPLPKARPAVAIKGRSAESDALAAGMATRSSDHFQIVYADRGRDFAQRARYEQRVLDVLERAHAAVQQRLGDAPQGPTEVVLYTEEEFRLHFGSVFGGQILGFYSGKIRMNRSDAVDGRYYATAVHEYVHAAVDAQAAGRGDAVPVWLNEGLARWVERSVTGSDVVSDAEKLQLRLAKRDGHLPPLAQLAGTPLISLGGQGAALAYAQGSAAVQSLVGSAGDRLPQLLRVFRALGTGTAFEPAMDAEFGPGRLQRLDADVDSIANEALRRH